MSLQEQSDDVSSLSNVQEKVLSILPIPSALLSIAGSSLIIYLIAFKTKKQSPYTRILLGMSICDVIISITFAFQAFLLPRETSQRVWAIGNDATCSALGFFLQFSFTAYWYNGMLSFYYLLTIRLGMTEQRIGKRIEPIMHFLSVGYPLVTAMIGAGLGIYKESEVGLSCWIKDYPSNCGDEPGESGEWCKSELLAWIFGGIPTFAMLGFILVNNLIITVYVRSSIRRSRGHLASQYEQTVIRVRNVATQALLYVAAFFSTVIFLIALKVLEAASYSAQDEDKVFPLLVLQAIFAPLTGAFNFLVYLRPRYVRVRKDSLQESRLWCARRALFGDDAAVSRPMMLTTGLSMQRITTTLQREHSRRRTLLRDDTGTSHGQRHANTGSGNQEGTIRHQEEQPFTESSHNGQHNSSRKTQAIGNERSDTNEEHASSVAPATIHNTAQYGPR